MDFKYHLETAWKTTLDHIAAVIFLTLVTAAVSIISLGILAPVAMAGYMHAMLLLVRDGREPVVQDVFSQMRLFFPLLIFGVLVTVGALIGFAILFLPGLIFVLAVSYCCIYLLPLMTDRGLGLVDAARESYDMVTRGSVGDHVIVYILFVGITAAGNAVLLGALLTQPLATIFLMSVFVGLTRGGTGTKSQAPSSPHRPPTPTSGGSAA